VLELVKVIVELRDSSIYALATIVLKRKLVD
jgi:hypothetical protein